MEFTRWLNFMRIVLQAVKKLKRIIIKKFVIIEKYCGDKNILWQWKDILVMEAYCSNGYIL